MNNKLQNQNLESLFFKDSALDNKKVDKIVSDSLANADDGELYLQFEESENFVFDDQRLKSASFDVSKGFGLRAVAEDTTGYAHSSDINEDALKKASVIIDFTTPKCTLEVLKIAAKLKKRMVGLTHIVNKFR